MRNTFRVMALLFAFLFVSACSNNQSIYETKMVSSTGNNLYRVSNGEEDVLKANVMIFNNNFSSLLGLKYKENNSYGSGVIYKSDKNFYYVLTNNHVVKHDYSYNSQELYVEDYYFNKYAAEVVYSDVNYDLAIIKFAKNTELAVLNINEKINVRDSIRSMGNPNSVKNVLTEGMVNCFSYINLSSDKSKVNFEVIVHSANIAGGSSGGALLNHNNEIIGITFAGVFDNNGNFITGYAIPGERIIEFLNK